MLLTLLWYLYVICGISYWAFLSCIALAQTAVCSAYSNGHNYVDTILGDDHWFCTYFVYDRTISDWGICFMLVTLAIPLTALVWPVFSVGYIMSKIISIFKLRNILVTAVKRVFKPMKGSAYATRK